MLVASKIGYYNLQDAVVLRSAVVLFGGHLSCIHEALQSWTSICTLSCHRRCSHTQPTGRLVYVCMPWRSPVTKLMEMHGDNNEDLGMEVERQEEGEAGNEYVEEE